MKIIILLGRPGSGKGTQAKLLIKKFGLEYIGVGDLVRTRQQIKDFSGQKLLKVSAKKGELVPSFLISSFWTAKFEELKQKPKFKGFVLDGSSRILIESQLIVEALKWYQWQKNTKIILVDISEKESIWRLTKRRICKDCGRIIPYIGEFKKIKKCDKCQGKLIIRKDQSLSAIKKRIKEFNEKTKLAINYYQKQGTLIKVNGEQSIEAIHKDILEIIK
ncbi:MAG: nucleoside monophosphate kinase [Candidatus Pacebacteria bacterium]|nr:nucleoside monophosphate kinase [Candidatus Paceibacterota bacterium]